MALCSKGTMPYSSNLLPRITTYFLCQISIFLFFNFMQIPASTLWKPLIHWGHRGEQAASIVWFRRHSLSVGHQVCCAVSSLIFFYGHIIPILSIKLGSFQISLLNPGITKKIKQHWEILSTYDFVNSFFNHHYFYSRFFFWDLNLHILFYWLS